MLCQLWPARKEAELQAQKIRKTGQSERKKQQKMNGKTNNKTQPKCLIQKVFVACIRSYWMDQIVIISLRCAFFFYLFLRILRNNGFLFLNVTAVSQCLVIICRWLFSFGRCGVNFHFSLSMSLLSPFSKITVRWFDLLAYAGVNQINTLSVSSTIGSSNFKSPIQVESRVSIFRFVFSYIIYIS